MSERVRILIELPREFAPDGPHIASVDQVPFLACGAFAPDASGDRCGEFIGHGGKHVTTSGKEWAGGSPAVSVGGLGHGTAGAEQEDLGGLGFAESCEKGEKA